jgi:hypothetical protein
MTDDEPRTLPPDARFNPHTKGQASPVGAGPVSGSPVDRH